MTTHKEIFIMNTDLHEVLWLNTNVVYLFLFDIFTAFLLLCKLCKR